MRKRKNRCRYLGEVEKTTHSRETINGCSARVFSFAYVQWYGGLMLLSPSNRLHWNTSRTDWTYLHCVCALEMAINLLTTDCQLYELPSFAENLVGLSGILGGFQILLLDVLEICTGLTADHYWRICSPYTKYSVFFKARFMQANMEPRIIKLLAPLISTAKIAHIALLNRMTPIQNLCCPFKPGLLNRWDV